MKTNPSRRRGGFTLAELMIAMAVFGVVLASAVGFLVAQTKSFRVEPNATTKVAVSFLQD